MTFTGAILLLLLAAGGVIAVRAMARGVVPAVAAENRDWMGQLVLDLWIPLTLMAPAATAALRIGARVDEAGPIALTLPATSGGLAAGAALLAGTSAREMIGERRTTALALAGLSGLVLILIAITDRLGLAVGQAMFAAAVVVMWFNTPRVESGATSDQAATGAERRLWSAIMVLVLVATVQSFCMLAIPPRWLGVAGGILALELAMALVVLAVGARGGAAARAGQWLAIYGVLFAVGLVSIAKVLRAAIPFIFADETDLVLQLDYGTARGFGGYAIEGAFLALIPIVIVTARDLPRSASRIIGAAIVTAAATLIAWRLASL